MPTFDELLDDALRRATFVSLVLSKRRGTAPAGPEKVAVRPVNVRGEQHLQFAERIGNREVHENLAPEDAVARVRTLLGETFAHGHLFTTEADWSARSKSGGETKLHKSPPTKLPVAAEHDRTKRHLIPEGNPVPFLIEMGVMTAAGKVRASRRKKFRQINRFLELVDDVLDRLPGEGTLNVVDFGCGKSYLTFALHHLLTEIRGREVDIVGLDRNPEVIDTCRAVGERLGCEGLRFDVGDIADHRTETGVDLAVWLHACDTATDDALAQAVAWRTRVILAVPCCQHELAPRISNEALSPLLEQGILRERFAALATDALRSQALKVLGYRVQVVEFIDLEHTAKNVLIRGFAEDGSPDRITEQADAYRQLKRLLGLEEVDLHLERALGEEFGKRVRA